VHYADGLYRHENAACRNKFSNNCTPLEINTFADCAMAEIVADKANKEGAEVRLNEVSGASNDDLVSADAITIGSPVYLGLPSVEIKKFIDSSVSVRNQLENKVAPPCQLCAPCRGKETIIMALLQALLVHGMVVCGDSISSGGHYGAAETGTLMISPRRSVLVWQKSSNARI